MADKIVQQTEAKMVDAIEHLKQELSRVRTGRANPNMLDQVMVEAYGTKMKLVELASVTTPEPRMLLISPFDHNNSGLISKGIERANLGLQPVAEGNVVRISIPPMDEAARNEKAKLCHRHGEESKVRIRNVRRDGNELIRKMKADGLSEDEIKGHEKKIQKLTDDYCHQIEELVKKKEQEVLTI